MEIRAFRKKVIPEKGAAVNMLLTEFVELLIDLGVKACLCENHTLEM